MNTRLMVRLVAMVATVVVVCGAAVALLGIANRDLGRSASAAKASDRTVNAARAVEASVVDAETALRGYAIARRERFLLPYREASVALPTQVSELVRSVNDDPRLLPVAREIERRAYAYLRTFSEPLLSATTRSTAEGRAVIATEVGKRQVDTLRGQVTQIVAVAQRSGDQAAEAQASAAGARRALRLALGAVAVALVLLFGMLAYLARSVVVPIRRVADAATQIGAGDFAVRLDDQRRDEIGQLGAAFNAMSRSLQTSAREIDDQQSELEMQNAELQSQSRELVAQSVERSDAQDQLHRLNMSLRQQAVDLHATSEVVRLSQARDAIFAEVAQDLGLRPRLDDQAETLLSAAAAMTDAVIGSVYVVTEPSDGRYRCIGSRGVDADALSPVAEPGSGLVGRAVRERETVQVSRPDGELSVESFGVEIPVHFEVHIPLIHGVEVVGVLSLGRTAQAFAEEELVALEHLAGLAAVSFENAIEVQRTDRLADLNRAVLEAAGDAIHLSGLDGQTILTNPEMDRFRSEVLGISPDSEQPAGGDLIPAIAQRTVNPQEHERRLRQISDDPEYEGSDEYELIDTRRWVHRYTAPVRTSAGALMGRIFVMRETTRERQAEQAKDKLMETVSHELRTPLSAILGYVDLLLDHDPGQADRAEYLTTIKEQGLRLAALINDFLDLQRLPHGSESATELVDLGDLLEQQVRLFSQQSDRHTLTFHSSGDMAASGDSDSLRRVIGNLLSNAIKYSPEGGAIGAQAAQHNGSITVTITDHGMGMAEDERRHAFERFFRGDAGMIKGIEGTGLGLALVKEMVEAGGGEVGCDSAQGEGSSFWFTVPASASTS